MRRNGQWLAALTPWMDDGGSIEVWPGMIRRYGSVAARWHVLTPDDWQRCLWRTCIVTVREAMTHTTDATVLAVCEQSIASVQMFLDGKPRGGGDGGGEGGGRSPNCGHPRHHRGCVH